MMDKKLVCMMIAMTFCNSCRDRSKPVHHATGTLPVLPQIDVSDVDRFLNDLKLSPLWKVEKERDGSFVAKARSIAQASRPDGQNVFLFELMSTADKALPEDYQIRDGYLLGGNGFFTFRVTVVFGRPDLTRVSIGESGQEVTLGVYEPSERQIGSSVLAIKLSSQHEVYAILHEQSSDPARRTTFVKALPALQELARIAGSPKVYRVEERYTEFFTLFFILPLKDQELKRFPGSQDRDTIYGYLRTKPSTSYNGANIRITHPVYCPDECTRKHSRLQKAEHLGTPYYEGDVLFFQIEDNAVYLPPEYDEKFGTFTGKESFEGTLELLNDQEAVLLKTTAQFKGWQR